MAIDTSGFNLALPQEPIVTPALANVAPLNMPMQGMAWKPLAIQEPSSAVSEGIASALGSIGKGITAAYQNAQEVKKQKAEYAFRQQQAAAAQAQHEASQQMSQARLGMEQQRLGIEATKAENEQSYREAMLRMKQVGGDKPPKPRAMPIPLDGAAQQPQQQEAPAAGEGPSEFGPNPFSSDLQDQDVSAPEAEVPEGTVSVTPVPLAGLSPLSSEQVAKTNAMLPSSFGDITAYSVAGPGAGTPAPVSGGPSFFSPQDVKASLKGLGAPQAQQELRRQLNETERGMLSTLTPDQIRANDIQEISKTYDKATLVPALESKINVEGPYTPEDAMKLKKYAESRGLGSPIVKPYLNTGLSVVDWATLQKEKEAKEAKQLAQSARSEQTDRLYSSRVMNQMGRDVRDFNTDKNVANYKNSRGFFAMLPRISAAYESAMKDPNSSGIPDAEIAQLLAQAASGGVATRGSIEDFLHGQGVKDTLENWSHAVLGGGKSGLSTRAKNQAVELIIEEAKGQAQQANQSYHGWKSTYQDRTDEETLGQHLRPFIEPQTRADAQKALSEQVNKVVDLKKLYDAAVAKKDPRADDIHKEWFKASREAFATKAKLANASGPIVNLHEILTEPQGFLSPVPINKIRPEALRLMKTSVADRPELDNPNSMSYDAALYSP